MNQVHNKENKAAFLCGVEMTGFAFKQKTRVY